MKKWKCVDKNGCPSECEFETTCTGKPDFCPLDGHSAKWEEVAGESEQKPNEPVTDCNQLATNCSQLPDWCEVGGWFYFASSNFEEDRKYLKITESKNGGIFAKEKYDSDPCWFSFVSLKQFAKPASLRPWTAREAIGKVVCWEGDYSHRENIAIINAVDFEGFVIGDLIGNTDLQGLTTSCFYQPDGKPCGVLEHMSDDGEWEA